MVKKRPRDPTAPKRNVSTYILYQNAMRDQFKRANPGMTFGQLAKYTSAMYSEMPPADKDGWAVRAEADKARYLEQLASYVPPPGYDANGDAMLVPSGATVDGIPIFADYIRERPVKKEKDIHAPKRNVSAYIIYQNAMREQFKTENPGMTFGQLAKYTSHMYRNLTPEERTTWDAHAQQDKTRYDHQMAAYNPPPGHDARGNIVEDHQHRLIKRRTKRKAKDPNAPKRACGAYVFFTNEMRPIVTEQFPGIKFIEMGRVLGERWHAIDPEEKKRFEYMAIEDKRRYEMEMQHYTAAKAVQQQVAVHQHQQQLQQQHMMSQQFQHQHAMSQRQLHEQHVQPHMNMLPIPNPQQYNVDPHQYPPSDYYGHHQYHESL